MPVEETPAETVQAEEPEASEEKAVD